MWFLLLLLFPVNFDWQVSENFCEVNQFSNGLYGDNLYVPLSYKYFSSKCEFKLDLVGDGSKYKHVFFKGVEIHNAGKTFSSGCEEKVSLINLRGDLKVKPLSCDDGGVWLTGSSEELDKLNFYKLDFPLYLPKYLVLKLGIDGSQTAINSFTNSIQQLEKYR